MTRLSCCFCSGGTEKVPPGTYFEFRITLPGLEERGTQWFGAHVSCFNRSTPPAYEIVLSDPDETRQPALAEHVSVAPYRETQGIVPLEGGNAHLGESSGTVAVTADSAGLRDLARTLLALADPSAPEHTLIRIRPGEIPLVESSAALVIARAASGEFE